MLVDDEEKAATQPKEAALKVLKNRWLGEMKRFAMAGSGWESAVNWQETEKSRTRETGGEGFCYE